MVKESEGEVQGALRMAGMHKSVRSTSSTHDSKALPANKAGVRKRSSVVRETSSKTRSSKTKDEASSRTDADRSVALRSAISYFPGKDFLEGQKEAIEQIDEAFKKHRFVLVEAPTGSGKSFLGVTFALQSGNAHILTPQKILQTQYQNEEAFKEHVFVMMGKSNYTCQFCEIDPVTKQEVAISCAEGECNRSRSKAIRSGCPYKMAIAAAQQAPIVIHNFDSFYFQTRAYLFARRKMLVIDECHNIEQKILGFVSFTIGNRKDRTMAIPKFEKIEQYDEFLKVQAKERFEEVESLNERFEEGMLSKEELKRKTELEDLLAKLQTYLDIRKKGRGDEYVFDWVDHTQYGYQAVTFRPVFVGPFAVERLFPLGEKVLMMSATVCSKEMFCKNVGLDPSEVAYIQMESHFPVENRPIIKRYVGPMKFDKISETLPKMLEEIKVLLEKHKTRKGIIHTGNERIAQYIKANLFDPRLTFNKDFRTVDEMLKVHMTKEASVIVASGLKEGLDLKDDLSRIQLLCKIPYPDLSDKRVARRKTIDPAWYGYLTALSFVQSIGRSVRSKTDKAVTYVLDEGFEMFVRMNRKFIPEYVLKAIRK